MTTRPTCVSGALRLEQQERACVALTAMLVHEATPAELARLAGSGLDECRVIAMCEQRRRRNRARDRAPLEPL